MPFFHLERQQHPRDIYKEYSCHRCNWYWFSAIHLEDFIETETLEVVSFGFQWTQSKKTKKLSCIDKKVGKSKLAVTPSFSQLGVDREIYKAKQVVSVCNVPGLVYETRRETLTRYKDTLDVPMYFRFDDSFRWSVIILSRHQCCAEEFLWLHKSLLKTAWI